MSIDDKIEAIDSLLPNGWSLKQGENGEGSITNRDGEKKVITVQEDSVVIDGKSFTYKNFENALPLIMPFIYQCFDGKQRM